MNDTPDEIMEMQHKIFFAKSEEQRFLFAMQMVEDGFELSKAAIRNENPSISEKDLKLDLFKKLYSTDFSDEEFEIISSHLNSH